MKLLILACLLGISAAAFLQEAAPVIDNAVMSFWYGASKAGSLSDALGIYDPIIDQIEDDTKTEMGKVLKEALNKLLEHIQDHIDHKKQVTVDMLEKMKELGEKLKELKIDIGNKAKELFEKIKGKVSSWFKELISGWLEKRSLNGKRSFNDEYDQVARMKFRDIVEKIKEKILENETIQKIKEYIKNLVTENPIIKKVKEFFEKLGDADLREILRHLLEYRPGKQQRSLKETWEKMKNWFKERHIELKEHFEKLGQWVIDMWGKGLDKLNEKHGMIKAIALEFIAHIKDTSKEVQREMLEFLEPYKDDLGVLWKQIIEAVKQHIGD